MPEVKNTFIQSKMNKDLDGRILPNGQYRDGQNVQISRSEGDDVGALENVLGNEFLSNFNITNNEVEIIGYLKSDTLDSIFLFLTNYTDSSPSKLDNIASGIAGEHYIVRYDIKNSLSTTLVQGDFLNFSKTHPITGVNLLEDLLFWTDNRNQPRKINITLAKDLSFYTREDQISVSKYYPYEPISLLEEDSASNGRFQSSMKDVVSDYLPIHAAARIADVQVGGNSNKINLSGIYTNIRPDANGIHGDKVTGANLDFDEDSNNPITVKDFLIYPSTSTDYGKTLIELANLQGPHPDVGDILYFQRQNPQYNPKWPGDKEYLKKRFPRFSYRFKFIDGEYSLSAPFTQIAFVPEQDGYFIGKDAIIGEEDPEGSLVGDEGSTIESTIVGFMKNKIKDIGLFIPAPTTGNSTQRLTWAQVNNRLHITEIDILYKEAQSNKTTIVDTLLLSDIGNLNQEFYKYEYQSKKPWKTLPPSQTTRTSEATPIRALAQEVSGNRVMYGNYIDKHSSPINLNYTVQIDQKIPLPKQESPLPSNFNERYAYVRKEYQNHTLKQNRTYQVGIVLYDRYGRQSNVILSSIINPNAFDQRGSTIYHSYKNSEDTLLTDKYPNDGFLNPSDADTWPGDQLNLFFYSIIPKLKNSEGYPGLYSEVDGKIVSLSFSGIDQIPPDPPNWDPANNSCVVTGSIKGKDATQIGSVTLSFYPDGTVNEVISITSSSGWTNGESFFIEFDPVGSPGCIVPTSANNLSGTVVTSISNPLGWYSWKAVVKQSEQEYYNVYLPTTLAGYPCNVDGVEPPSDGEYGMPEFKYDRNAFNNTSHIVLFGDNINKVSRDLQEVGPTQEKYRSSVKLFGRVNNVVQDWSGNQDAVSNVGFNPSSDPDIAAQISTMTNLGLGDLTTNPTYPIIPNIFFEGKTNPQIARVKTNKKFGILSLGCNPDEADPGPNDQSTMYGTTLSVYETSPFESELDIFWETTTSGLISDLNFKIENEDNTIPVDLSDTQINWSEEDGVGTIISATFEAIGSSGQGLGNSCVIELDSVTRADGAPIVNLISLQEDGVGTGEYYLLIDTTNNYPPLFRCYNNDLLNLYYFKFTITRDNGIDPPISIQVERSGTVGNVAPNAVIGPALPGSSITNMTWQEVKTSMNARWNDSSITIADLPRGETLFTPEYSSVYPDNSGDFGKQNYINAFNNGTISSTSNFGDPGFEGHVGYGKVYAAIDVSGGYKHTAWMGMGYGINMYDNSLSLRDANYETFVPASEYWGFPSGLYNSIDGFVPERPNNNYVNYPSGRERNTPVWTTTNDTAPLDGCDATFEVDTTSYYPGWQRIGRFFQGEGIHNGIFEAFNGLYGSAAGIPFPPALGRAEEIVFSIPRMYQVSMFMRSPYYPSLTNNTINYPQNFASNGQAPYPFSPRIKFPIQYNYFEYVFGLYPVPISAQWTTDPSPDTTTNAFGFYDWNDQVSTQQPQLGRKVAELPHTPIYWDANNSTRPGAQGGDQSIYARGGEEYVGQRYNNGNHYWADLEALSENVFDKFAGKYGWTSKKEMGMFRLDYRPGANTFYYASGASRNQGDTYCTFPQQLGEFWGSQPANASGYAGYMGPLGAQGTASEGVCDPLESRFTFNAKTLPVTFNPASGYDNPRGGYIHAGDSNLGIKDIRWNTACDGLSAYLSGNGVPPGRYVVTLRATDLSPGPLPDPKGAYVEWDVPVYVPMFNEALCTKCSLINAYYFNP